MSELLTQDKKRVALLENGITINYNLPKYKNAKPYESLEERGIKIISRQTVQDEKGNTYSNMSTPFAISSNSYEMDKDLNFDVIASATLEDLTTMINETNIKHILCGYGGMNKLMASSINYYSDKPVTFTLFTVVKNYLNRVFKKKEKFKFDATQFFTNVKLTSKEAAKNYKDRVSLYLKAIHNAKTAGQTALIEKLLKEMIANKYESLLFAEGYYYAVNEEQIVKFAKQTEKGISLSYIENFGRPIPEDVISKIEEVNALEVFDNYVVLYYDPDGKIYKETEKQVAKRKDPILFGVIAGSSKLYYVTDWVDEYCDLTLEKFVDTLKISKEDLIFDDKKKKSEKTRIKKENNEKKEKSNEKKVSNKKRKI